VFGTQFALDEAGEPLRGSDLRNVVPVMALGENVEKSL
jgi:hypothetical protein